MKKKITALVIMDGFGMRDQTEGNAVAMSGVPSITALCKKYPHTTLGASGMSVGLPDGQMGNSEVGHLNIGAGRIVYQELTRISKAIVDGDFFHVPEFLEAMKNAKKSALHLMGLVSDGGVHSHIEHLLALVKMAKANGVAKIFIHCFMDGRDVPPDSGKQYLESLECELEKIGAGKIATVSGRYYAMDRDNRWERVQLAYDCLVNGKGYTSTSAVKAMQESYDRDELDEFVKPTCIDPDGTIKEGDSIIFFNFRPDRARELTRVFTVEDFDGFERNFFPVKFVCMTEYDESFKNVSIAYKQRSLHNTLGEYIAGLGKTQFRIAETEKYAHVTFFFNGGVEKENIGEDRFLIPSPKVATYDLQPEMSAPEVTQKALELIKEGNYDFMILNFANPDMVGHTGVLDAAITAVNIVDKFVGQIAKAIIEEGGQVIITADHGNSDMMTDPNGARFTAHTLSPVPCIVVSEKYKDFALRKDGILADIAPTLLFLADIPVPAEMEGTNLLKEFRG